MRSGASTTAQLTAFFRAVADAGGTAVRDFHDPTAEHLLSPAWSMGLTVLRRGLRYSVVRRGFVATVARALDGIALRTRAIDAAWNEAGAGCSQLVILGAGLDGRAWRLHGVERVFEVDHPATQRYKRRKAADFPAPVDLRWVAVDLERDDLGEALQRVGFDSSLRSFWIWEGVIPYLAKSTTEAVLRTIAACSAPGSHLAATYVPPAAKAQTARMLDPVRKVFGRLGEPFLGLMRPDELAAALEHAGFVVVSDTGLPDWADRFGEETAKLTQDLGERMTVAERETTPA